MANLLAVVGPSGSGKSYSLRNLNHEETVIINVAGKPLPFPGWRRNYTKGKLSEGGNYFCVSDIDSIEAVLKAVEKMPHIKNLVIEDYQYLMGFAFMSRASEKGYDKFAVIGDIGFRPLNIARTLREDLNVIFMCHDEEVNGKRKIKTSGKMVDNHITLEGLFTIVLFTNVELNKGGELQYEFITNSDMTMTAKSPPKMFDRHIPNDLQGVLETIQHYYSGEMVAA